MRCAVTAGSSGLVGGFLLERLLHESLYSDVYALVRKPVKSSAKQVVVDFGSLEQFSIPVGGPIDLFCTLGSTIKKAGSQAAFRAVDHDAVLSFAKWGLARGAERFFLVSALGADPKSKMFYSRVKGETEVAIEALPFKEVHIFRPSLLLGPRNEMRLGERFAEKASKLMSFAFRGPLKAYEPIEAKDVADAMVNTAIMPASAGSHVYSSQQIRELALEGR